MWPFKRPTEDEKRRKAWRDRVIANSRMQSWLSVNCPHEYLEGKHEALEKRVAALEAEKRAEPEPDWDAEEPPMVRLDGRPMEGEA